jgi:hypothetical protein
LSRKEEARPSTTANRRRTLGFGDDGKTLYLTSKDMLARIRLNVRGVGF